MARQTEHRGWLWWAALLTAGYLIVSLIGWRRPLIPDEIWGLLNASGSLAEQMEGLRVDMVHPPLSQLAQRVWMGTFGEGDTSIRILITLINIPSIILFTALAHRLTQHWRFASFAFAVVFLQVGSIAHLARMYGFAVLFAVIALGLWERWRREADWRVLAAWAVAMVLLIQSHYGGLLLLGGFVVSEWILGKRRVMVTAVGAGVVATFVPWALYVASVYRNRGLSANIGWLVEEDAVFEVLLKMPYYVLSRIPRGSDAFEEVSWFAFFGSDRIPGIAALALTAALIAAAWWGYRSRRHSAAEPALRPVPYEWLITTAALVVVPTILLFGFSLAIYPALHPRFLFAFWPACWLLITYLTELAKPRAGSVLRVAIAAWLVVGIASAATTGARSPLRGDLERLTASVASGDRIVVPGITLGSQVYWEWTRRLRRTEPVAVVATPLNVWRLPLYDDIGAIDFDGTSRVWMATLGSAARIDRIIGEFAAFGFSLSSGAPAPWMYQLTKAGAAAIVY